MYAIKPKTRAGLYLLKHWVVMIAGEKEKNPLWRGLYRPIKNASQGSDALNGGESETCGLHCWRIQMSPGQGMADKAQFCILLGPGTVSC